MPSSPNVRRSGSTAEPGLPRGWLRPIARRMRMAPFDRLNGEEARFFGGRKAFADELGPLCGTAPQRVLSATTHHTQCSSIADIRGLLDQTLSLPETTYHRQSIYQESLQ